MKTILSRLLANRIITSLLSILIIVLILYLILFPIAENIVEPANAGLIESAEVKNPELESQAIEKEKLVLGFPYKLDSPIIEIPNPSLIEIQKPKVSSQKVSVTKPKVTPTTKPTSTPKITPTTIEDIDLPQEEIVSTMEIRDLERAGLIELLSDRIAEYAFLYDSYPKLYSNKSKTLLKDKPNHTVYLYEEDKNKTNALALEIGSDSYLLQQVDDCSNNISIDDLIKFTYSNEELTLCKEDGGLFKSSIMRFTD